MSQKFWAILKKPKVTTTLWLCKANPPPRAWWGLAQAAQGSCGCPILGWGDLGSPGCGQGALTMEGGRMGSLPSQTGLWDYEAPVKTSLSRDSKTRRISGRSTYMHFALLFCSKIIRNTNSLLTWRKKLFGSQISLLRCLISQFFMESLTSCIAYNQACMRTRNTCITQNNLFTPFPT